MTTMTKRWFMYGEPIGNQRMEAEIRQTYNDGSEDKVTHGTIGYESLDMMENDSEIIEHIHDDNSVCLSMLSIEKEEEFMETWEEHDNEQGYYDGIDEAFDRVDELFQEQ